MSLPVVFSRAAEADFDDAVDWYQQCSGNGAEFIESVREALNIIGQTPELHAFTFKDVRKAMLRRFPYIILYRIKFDRVEVISVFHGRRDPSEWRKRL